MSVIAPDEFTRAFSTAWSARDPDAIAALFVEDADFLTLTGAWCEGREAIVAVLKGEFAGAFQRAKIVTGRVKQRSAGPMSAVVMQRFVLSGLVDEAGRDAGRVGAVLSATLTRTDGQWQAVTASFTAEA